ncbi:hypothetical protein V6N11_072968 [Hibiscus sabdariffa]|uniref:Uncharacterized protein n=1 Tax=Hibiscus sabdariffa TaxID=183260 RepID=A0ABR2NWS8_9ROSI
MESECKDLWIEAMEYELHSSHDNHTFELVKLPKGNSVTLWYSFDDYVIFTDEGEPEYYEDDMESECKDLWIEAMEYELHSSHDNHTFELVKLTKGNSVTL